MNYKNEQNTCKICFKISCRQCNWIASEEDVILIQQGKMTACPLCGWRPGSRDKNI